MNVHKNARLTPAGRALLARRVSQGWTAKAAAEAAGVSVRTVRKWIARHRRGGERRHHDRSSAPRRCPRRTPPSQVAQIEQLRRRRMTGPAIAWALGMARSTVGAILRRLGLGKLKTLEPKPPVVRYERSAPGEMIHLDIKKLGKIKGVGHRFAPRGPGMHGNKGHGWDFLHVCVDDASRLAYTEILPSEGQVDTTAFLERALAWLARHGVTVERVMPTTARPTARSSSPGPCSAPAPATSEPDPTRPAPTARPSASSRPACANGLTPSPTALRLSEPKPSSPGSTATTSPDPTPA
jgi:transposase